MHRQVLLLAAAQALVQTASTLVMTVGGLAGVQTARAHQLATAPIASMFLGTVATIVPASIWMVRSGRRPGFIAGALLGALGGAFAAVGVYSGSLVVLCFGTLLIGAYQATAQFYRFAASEVADDPFRPRAISLVLAGGVVAALLGPTFARLGAPLLQTAYVGSFLILAATSLAAAGLLLGLRVPTPKADGGGSEPRPLLAIMRQPTYAVALLGAATGSGVMILAMTATPLAMVDHHHTLSEAAIVIQLHVLGMFLPFVRHGLADRTVRRCGDHAHRGCTHVGTRRVERRCGRLRLLRIGALSPRGRLEFPLRGRYDAAHARLPSGGKGTRASR
jgi:MFS family permease